MKITTTFLSIAAVLLLAVACVNGSAEPSDVTYLFVLSVRALYPATSRLTAGCLMLYHPHHG